MSVYRAALQRPFLDLLRGVWRFWWLTLLLCALTGVGMSAVNSTAVRDSYTATVHMALYGPPPGSHSVFASPTGLRTLGQSAALAATDTEALGRLAALGLSTDVTLELSPADPIVEIGATAATEDVARATVARVQDMLVAEIAELQQQLDVVGADQAKAKPVESSAGITITSGRPMRSFGVFLTALLGALLAVWVPSLLDLLLPRRDRRRRGHSVARVGRQRGYAFDDIIELPKIPDAPSADPLRAGSGVDALTGGR